MSLHIYIAHTGEHLLADPVSFASYVIAFIDICPTSRSPLTGMKQPRRTPVMDCSQYVDRLSEADINDCARQECQNPDSSYRGKAITILPGVYHID